jgi:hypothetical protein
MNFDLATLQKFDHKTAEGVLAAAALSTAPNPGVDENPQFLNRYSKQAEDVLLEIRSRLQISPTDNSIPARTAIDNVLSKALEGLILNPANTSSALNRAGQSGRLAPVIYQVVQPKPFSTLFYTLGISASHVEDAVKHPDDHQHLMAEGMPEDAKTLSLFMKQVTSRDVRNSRWLLVQTNRIGLQQHVQAAWIVFPSDVDLSMASAPIDALRAFVDVFGCPISVGDKKALFVDPQQFPFNASVKVDWTGAPREHFVNFSQTTNADTRLFKVGVAYCIDIPKYRASLKKHGIRVQEPTSSMVFA